MITEILMWRSPFYYDETLETEEEDVKISQTQKKKLNKDIRQ
jgi:hypothetical protein